MTTGEKILRLRKARGWSQEELASHISVTRQSVSRWESDSAKPDTDKVIALCDLFGISADYLLRDSSAVDTALTSPPSSPKEARRGFTASQALGFGLFALALVLLFAMVLVGILEPHTLYTDHGTYHGIQAHIRVYNLEWTLWLLYAIMAGGIFLMFQEPLLRLIQKIRNRKNP